MFVQPDLFAIPVQADDLIVLCTDGVWGHVEDHEFAGFALAEPSLEGYNQALIDEAIRRGSDDNLSLLSLRFRTLTGRPHPAPSGSGLGAFFSRVFRR